MIIEQFDEIDFHGGKVLGTGWSISNGGIIDFRILRPKTGELDISQGNKKSSYTKKYANVCILRFYGVGNALISEIFRETTEFSGPVSQEIIIDKGSHLSTITKNADGTYVLRIKEDSVSSYTIIANRATLELFDSDEKGHAITKPCQNPFPPELGGFFKQENGSKS